MLKSILRFLCISAVFLIGSFSSLAQDETLACDPNFTIENDEPVELRESTSHLVALNRNSNSWRFIDINGIESNPRWSDFQIPYFYGNIVLSPTHTIIMQERFTTEGQDQDVVITPLTIETNELIIPVDYVDNFFSPYWLNADTVVLSIQEDSETHRKLDYALANIKDQSIQKISISIPDNLGVPLERPDLSPDETLIIFPHLGEHVGREIVLLNIAGMDEFKIIDDFYFPRAIQWSPIGNFFFVTDNPDNSNAPQRLQIINRNGDKLHDVVLHPNYEHSVYDYEYQWSADEKWLLYRDAETQFRDVSEPFPRLLNIETGDVTDICLPGEAFWSPDNRFIAVIVRTATQENSPSTIVGLFVYDISSSKVYELPLMNPNSLGRMLGWADIR